MNGLEITRLINRDARLRKKFLGVFASDQILLLKNIKRPSSIIVNTDPSNQPGKHWIALYMDSDGSLDYFDSYGIKPYVSEIAEFINQHSSHTLYNMQRLQGSNSKVCGLYCIYFLHRRCRNTPMTNIINKFSTYEFKFNDWKLCNFIRKTFGVWQKVCGNGAQFCTQMIYNINDVV